jgi:hypothetical protein
VGFIQPLTCRPINREPNEKDRDGGIGGVLFLCWVEKLFSITLLGRPQRSQSLWLIFTGEVAGHDLSREYHLPLTHCNCTPFEQMMELCPYRTPPTAQQVLSRLFESGEVRTPLTSTTTARSAIIATRNKSIREPEGIPGRGAVLIIHSFRTAQSTHYGTNPLPCPHVFPDTRTRRAMPCCGQLLPNLSHPPQVEPCTHCHSSSRTQITAPSA